MNNHLTNEQFDHLTQFNHLANESIKFYLFMQNEPNLCVFWAVNGDCEEKRTQNEPNSKPKQTQFHPHNLSIKGIVRL
jgi:hypothetical protein